MSLLLSWLDFMKGMVGPLKFGTWAWKMLSYIPIWLGGKVNVLARISHEAGRRGR